MIMHDARYIHFRFRYKTLNVVGSSILRIRQWFLQRSEVYDHANCSELDRLSIKREDFKVYSIICYKAIIKIE